MSIPADANGKPIIPAREPGVERPWGRKEPGIVGIQHGLGNGTEAEETKLTCGHPSGIVVGDKGVDCNRGAGSCRIREARRTRTTRFTRSDTGSEKGRDK